MKNIKDVLIFATSSRLAYIIAFPWHKHAIDTNLARALVIQFDGVIIYDGWDYDDSRRNQNASPVRYVDVSDGCARRIKIELAKYNEPISQRELRDFIRDVEDAHFRTVDDTGANHNALFVWRLVRQFAGLEPLTMEDLPSFNEETKRYETPKNSRLLSTQESKA